MAAGFDRHEGHAAEEGEGQEGIAEHRETLRRWWRILQIADVAFVVVEGAVEGERSTIERDDEEEPGPKRVTPRPGPADRQEGAQEEVGRHDGPFGGPEVQQVGGSSLAEQLFQDSPRAHAVTLVFRGRMSAAALGSTSDSIAAMRWGTLNSVSTHIPWGRWSGIT